MLKKREKEMEKRRKSMPLLLKTGFAVFDSRFSFFFFLCVYSVYVFVCFSTFVLWVVFVFL